MLTAASPARATLPLSSAASTPFTPDDVMYVAEIRRSRVFATFACGLTLAASLAVALQPGDWIAKQVFWAGCAVCFLGGAAWLWKLRRPDAYVAKEGVYFGYLSVIAIGGAFYFFSPFSAVVMVVPIGAIMFAMGQGRREVVRMAVL